MNTTVFRSIMKKINKRKQIVEIEKEKCTIMRSLAKSAIPTTVAKAGILAVSSHAVDSGVCTNNRFRLGFRRRRSFSNSAMVFLKESLGLCLDNVCSCLQSWKMDRLDPSMASGIGFFNSHARKGNCNNLILLKNFDDFILGKFHRDYLFWFLYIFLNHRVNFCWSNQRVFFFFFFKQCESVSFSCNQLQKTIENNIFPC